MSVRASGYSTTVPVSVVDENRWTFISPTDPTIRVDGIKVLLPVDQEVTEQIGMYRPLGRSSAVVVTSAISGDDGRYIFMVTSDSEWTNVYALIRYQGTIFVIDPIGRTKYVRFLTRRWTEEGPVSKLRRRVTIDYVEVDEPE